MLEIGSQAPQFSLPNSDGCIVSLSKFKGKTVILYFYPKDNTPGCTKQACAFAEKYEEFAKRDAVVIGISKDSVLSHKKFVLKYTLPFILLSDQELTTVKNYDVWQEKKLYGNVSMGIERTTFIIDKDGKIEKIMSNVKPDKNAGEILEYLDGKP